MGVDERANVRNQLVMQGEAITLQGDAIVKLANGHKRIRDEVTRLHDLRQVANSEADDLKNRMLEAEEGLVSIRDAGSRRIDQLAREIAHLQIVTVGLVLAWALSVMGFIAAWRH